MRQIDLSPSISRYPKKRGSCYGVPLKLRPPVLPLLKNTAGAAIFLICPPVTEKPNNEQPKPAQRRADRKCRCIRTDHHGIPARKILRMYQSGHDLAAVDFRRSLRVESKSRARDLQLAQRFDVADRQGLVVLPLDLPRDSSPRRGVNWRSRMGRLGSRTPGLCTAAKHSRSFELLRSHSSVDN
jgi:hypothetical protein